MTDEKIKITQTLPMETVQWPAVLELLHRTFKYSFNDAMEHVRSFTRRVRRPLSASWFLRRELTDQENAIIASICVISGGDSVRLSTGCARKMGFISLQYRFTVTCTPALVREQSHGSAIPQIALSVAGRELYLTKLWQVLLTQVALFVLGSLLYALLAGLLLYGVAVLVLFIETPALSTIAATRAPSIGIALVCVLAGLAGIFGRAIRNLSLLAWTRVSSVVCRRWLEAKKSI